MPLGIIILFSLHHMDYIYFFKHRFCQKRLFYCLSLTLLPPAENVRRVNLHCFIALSSASTWTTFLRFFNWNWSLLRQKFLVAPGHSFNFKLHIFNIDFSRNYKKRSIFTALERNGAGREFSKWHDFP